MPRGLIFVAALAASCSPSGAENGSAGEPDVRAPAAVVTAASGGEGGCSYRWNEEAATPERIVERSVQTLEQGIEEVGGIEALTEDNIPFVRLEAAPDLAFACVGPALRQLQRSGFAHVVLKPAGVAAADQRVPFPILPEQARYNPEIVRIERGGRMRWGDAIVDVSGLRERVRLVRTMTPPVDLFVAPSADSSFMALYETMQAIEGEDMQAYLTGCDSTAGPIVQSVSTC